ncbi:hypothetical protein Tco_1283590 [Tanacetum coccineum]
MSTSSNTTFEFDVNHNGEFKLNPLTYQDGSVLNIHVFQMDFEDMVSYLKWKIPRGFTTLYYMLPPYYTLSGMKQIKNDYHTNVMYDIAKVVGKLQIFVSHTQIDLSTVLIPNDGSLEESFACVIFKETRIKLEESLSYLHQMQKKKKKKFNYYELLGELAQYKLEIYIDHIGVDFVISKYIFPNASLAEMMNHVITDYSSENEGIIRQETQNDYTFNKMVEWAEQEHFEYEETKTSHTISPISTMLSSTIESCLSNTHFFSLLTYYMAYGANEACQAIVLKLQREIQADEKLADQLSCNLARYTKETQALDEEAILEEQMLALMHRFADRFTDRRVEINNLMVLHDHQLIDYGDGLEFAKGFKEQQLMKLTMVEDVVVKMMATVVLVMQMVVTGGCVGFLYGPMRKKKEMG